MIRSKVVKNSIQCKLCGDIIDPSSDMTLLSAAVRLVLLMAGMIISESAMLKKDAS